MNESYSVVIPAYNAASTIDACLTSILAQTLLPSQVVVVDDASSDGTEPAVHRYQSQFANAGVALEYIRMSFNGGPSIARNKGLSVSRGTLVAFLDADDAWSPDKLQIVDRFIQGSSAGLVCHEYSEASQNGAKAPTASYEAQALSIYAMLLRNPAQTSCAVMRNVPTLKFDETLRYCEDYDLWMRIAEHARVVRVIGQPLARLGRPQLSPGGLSGETIKMRSGEMRVYFNFCSRNWRSRGWVLLPLIVFSISKHVYSWIRRGAESVGA